MKLSELLNKQSVNLMQGTYDQEITSLDYDSRLVKPGSLFVCIKGYKTDGHLFIRQAVANGAAAVLMENLEEIPGHVTVIKTADTRKTLPALAAAFYGNPSKELDLIGITGTNGKTTTTYLLKEILEHAGIKTGLMGTISNWIGDKEVKTIRTTPESVDFQCLLRNMVDQDVKACVMEVSSHSLTLNRVNYAHFHTGVFTNLTEDHLDFHRDMDDYRQEKQKLFYMTHKMNLINVDDPHGQLIAKRLNKDGISYAGYGIDKAGDLTAEETALSILGVSFKAVGLGMNHHIKLQIPGRFTVYNALAAIGAARSLDISPEVIQEALSNVTGVPGRLERIPEITDFSVMVDYAHTPDALENVLKTIRQFAEGRVITVFGCGGDRDQNKRPIMGEISGNLSDLSIITSDNPRSEDPDTILKMIEAGITATSGPYEVIESRQAAIRRAICLAQKGDVVLIAGKGHEKTQTIGQMTIHFDDLEIAREIAREEGRL
jgi:UDP-N-acetylmuramoyl-L-alanyl-D-glutamate--2,6-diaminopimelate ligase